MTARRLTLTFDNGPHLGWTERVLDELARRDLRATFFVVGTALQQPGARELALRAVDEGHAIGNHTMTHGTPLGRRPDGPETIDEIARLQSQLGSLAEPRKLFRPNAGQGRLGPHMLNRTAIQYLCANAYTVVSWNSVPRDWESPPDAWIDRALTDIERQEWTLLVLHDTPTSGAPDYLPRFLDQLARRKVEIVQDFPDECVLIASGRKTAALDRLVAMA